MRPLVGIALGSLSTAVALGAGALLAPQFRITMIATEGSTGLIRAEAETVARRFVEAEAQFAGAPRLFLFSRDRLVRELLAAIPKLATVQIVRKLPGTVALSLQERVPVASLSLGGQVVQLDSTGRVIAEVTREEAEATHLPLIRDEHSTVSVQPGDTVLSERVIQLLHEVVVLLPERLSVTAEELVIPAIGADEVRVRTTGGWELFLDARQPLGDQLGALERVIAEELDPESRDRLEYVDLRIPGKVYYRLRPFVPRRLP